MATIDVVFAGTYFTDPSTLVSVNVFKVDRVEVDSHAGGVRTYAGGRRRIISGPATDRSSALTLHRVSYADVETLRRFRGQCLLLRDGQGWRRWGSFLDLSIQSVFQGPVASPLFTVGLTWVDSDFVEAV